MVLDNSKISQQARKTQASKHMDYLLHTTYSACIFENEVRKVGKGPESLLSCTDLMKWDSHEKRQREGGRVHMCMRARTVCKLVSVGHYRFPDQENLEFMISDLQPR